MGGPVRTGPQNGPQSGRQNGRQNGPAGRAPSGAREARRSPRRRRAPTAPTREIINSHHLVADKIDRERPGGAAVLQVWGIAS